MSDRARFLIILSSVVAAVSIGVFCLIFFLQADFSLVGWMNALFYDGGITLLLGLLALVTHFGVFDMFVYGVRYIFFQMNPSQDKVRPYVDYVDYEEKKRERRKKKGYSFLIPFVAIGALLLISAIILRIVYANQTGISI